MENIYIFASYLFATPLFFVLLIHTTIQHFRIKKLKKENKTRDIKLWVPLIRKMNVWFAENGGVSNIQFGYTADVSLYYRFTFGAYSIYLETFIDDDDIDETVLNIYSNKECVLGYYGQLEECLQIIKNKTEINNG